MKIPIHIKSRLAALAIAAAAATAAQAQFIPFPLTPSSYTYDIVVESNFVFTALPDSVTATMDSGPISNGTGGNTWYEIGLDLAAPATGLPHAGATFTSVTQPDHVFQMAPSYFTNNVVFVGNYSTNYLGNGPGFGAGSITLVKPAAYNTLSVLTSAGNGPVVMTVSINHADGTSESPFSFIDSPDWFNAASSSSNYPAPAILAYIANGRITPAGAFNNVNGGAVCELWSVDLPLGDLTSPVTSIDFDYVSGGRCVLFALSGNTTSGGAFSPIAIGGYDADAIVEAQTNLPFTATMDSGTNIATGGNNTWFETGYLPSAPIADGPVAALTNGIPAHGSTFTSPLYQREYTMAPSYTVPNAILIDTNHQSVSIQPQTPTAEAALSFLVAGGNMPGNGMSNLCIIQHADGTSETNIVYGYDWFNGSVPPAWVANGRIDFSNGRQLNNFGSATSTGNDPRLFESEISLNDVTSPITNITLQYYNPANVYGTGAEEYFFAVSASQKGVPISIGTYTAAQNIYAGSNAYFSVGLFLGDRPTYQWQFVTTAGVTNNLANGGNISGVTTPTLTITDATASEAGYYQVVVTNSINTNVSPAAPLTFLTATGTNLTTPGDVISDFGNSSGSPAGEGVSEVIDGTLAPYVNSGPNGLSNGWGTGSSAGFIITPNLGTSIATALRIYTSSNSTASDPADIELEGSNDGGNTFAPILAQTSLTLPTGRNPLSGGLNASNEVLEEVDFANTTAYSTYRVTFHNLKDNTSTNGLQIAEVRILGGLAPLPPGVLTQPGPQVNAFSGGSFTVFVNPNGPGPFTYQWSFNGSPITGATNASLTISNAPSTAVGDYDVKVTNPFGSILSSNAVVNLLPGNPFALAVLALKPVSYWPMQETNGTIAYDFAGTNAGIYQPGTTQGQPGPNVGAFGPGGTNGYSVLFDGTSGYIDIPGPATPGPGNLMITNSMSCICWFLGGAPAGGFHTVWGRSDGSWRVDYDGTGNPHFAMNNDTGDGDATSATSIYDGKWHLLVGVYDAPTPTTGTNLLYVDGVLVATHLVPTPPGVDTYTDTWIGGTEQYGTSRLVPGNIAHCAVIPTAMTPAQVQSLYVISGVPPSVNIPTNAFYADQGGTVTFTASTNGGVPPFTYQWYVIDNKGVTNLVADQTNLTLTLTDVGVGANLAQTNNDFQYYLVANSANGPGSSPPATLNVYAGAPQLITDVVPTLAAPVGFPSTLSVVVYGAEPLTYQWSLNGAPVTGATNAIYAFPTITGTNLYSVTVSNSKGTVTSSTSTVTSIPTQLPIGFFGNGSNWTINQSGLTDSKISAGVFYGTDGSGGEGVTAWYNTPVFVNGFIATFTYQDVGGSDGNNADGSAFVLQEAGPTYENGGGGSLGITSLTPSADWEIDLYSPNGIGIIYHTDGTTGGYQSTGPVDVSGGDPINFTIQYTPGGAVLETLVDAVTGATYVTNYNIGDITQLLGSSLAYIGFASADGGVASSQTISNFSFITTVSPQLSIANGPSGTVLITWPLSVNSSFGLQESASVTGPWSKITTTPAQVNGNYQVSITEGPTSEFFRLAFQ